MKVKSEREVAQSCLTLHDPMDRSLPGSSVHGIFQARILEWVFLSSSRDLPDPGVETTSPLIGRFFTAGTPGKPGLFLTLINKDNVKFQFHVLKIKMYFKKSSK